MQYVQYAIFDSAIEHGNEVNTEGYTRMSFDFRVILHSQYRESSLDSWTQKIPFRVGEYYSVIRISE